MGWSLVQEKHDFSFSVSALVEVFPSAVAAGDLLIIWYDKSSGDAAPTIADTLGNTWTKFVGTPTPSGYGVLEAWWTVSASSGANTVTITDATSNNAISQIAQFNFSAGSIALDSNPTVTTGSGLVLSQNVTASVANDLVIGIPIPASGTTATTAGTGYTFWSGSGAYNAVYKFASGSGTYTPTINENVSGAWGFIAATFKGAGAPSVSKPVVCIME